MPLDRIAACSSRTRRGGEGRRGVVAGDGVDGGASSSWWASSGPSAVPGSTSAPNSRAGSPSRSISSRAQSPRARVEQPGGRGVRCSRWPARRRASRRAGRARARSAAAAASAAEPSSASSWKTVLIGIVWMPVTAYSSARGTRANARSTMPVGARVAVVERQAEHAAVARRAARSRRPRCRRRRRRSGPARAQPLERLGEQVQQVPAQAVGQPHGPVREAVDLLERHAPAVEAARARRGRSSRRGRSRRRRAQARWKTSSRRSKPGVGPLVGAARRTGPSRACQRALTSVASIAATARLEVLGLEVADQQPVLGAGRASSCSSRSRAARRASPARPRGGARGTRRADPGRTRSRKQTRSTSAHLRELEPEQRRDAAHLVRDVADAERDVVRRALARTSARRTRRAASAKRSRLFVLPIRKVVARGSTRPRRRAASAARRRSACSRRS